MDSGTRYVSADTDAATEGLPDGYRRRGRRQSVDGVVDADDPGEGRFAKNTRNRGKTRYRPGAIEPCGSRGYVLDGAIMEILKQQKPGRGGEIQLTDAIEVLAQQSGVHAYRYQGRRFDCGSKIVS